MGKHEWYDCRWDITHRNKGGEIIWQILGKRNLLTDEGERAIIDTFFRNKAANYFAATDFYVGFYNGTVSETTTLVTVPNEPAALYGYARQAIERSSVGWPTIEKHEGDWRVVSKKLTFQASGGNIGPITGAFLATGAASVGALIGNLSWGIERTVSPGDSFDVTLRVKLK